MHQNGWNGIWCAILADRFAISAIPKVSHIAGNPPWVKWSHLPTAYASFIKPVCQELDVFSDAHYVGGIESDISTVITFQAVRQWLDDEGVLAFYITATVFANDSSQGFRRFVVGSEEIECNVLRVEDFNAVRPFQGVANHPALLILQRDRTLSYPVPYCIWNKPARSLPSTAETVSEATRYLNSHDLLEARPVPGTDGGPWLKGKAADHSLWTRIMDASAESEFRARKGITTDRNGIYFVEVLAGREGPQDLVKIRNDPEVGRARDIPKVTMWIEKDHLFPLIRGRGIKPFHAEIDDKYRVLVPQRGMHGDPKLQDTCPKTYKYFKRFKKHLMVRGSYRKFQENQPYWSTWSTGAYTFEPYKVLWREMSGGRFCAAYVEPMLIERLGARVVVPDHKVYMVPVESLFEAQLLTGILNAPSIASAVSAYAAQLSLGTSVTKYLRLPPSNRGDSRQCQITELVQEEVDSGGQPTTSRLQELDDLTLGLLLGT